MRKYFLLLMSLMICSMGFAQEMEDEEETEEVEIYEVDPTAHVPHFLIWQVP